MGPALNAIFVVVLLIVLVVAAMLYLKARRRAAPARREAVGGARREAVGGAGRRKGAGRSGPAREPPGLDWPVGPCYPAPLINDALKAVRSVAGFSPATPEQSRALDEAAKRLGAKHGVSLSGRQLLSMRRMEAAFEARRAGARALRQGAAIAREVAAGAPVLAIAAKLDLPPLAVLKQALSEQGYSELQIKAMLAAPGTLPGRFAGEISGVFEADLGSRLHADRAKERSLAYEAAVGTYLRDRGAVFATEEELRRKGVQLTPDFLFAPPVTVNGRQVHWLDAKDYPMYGSRLVAKSLIRQAAKYTAAFGPGAMVFSGGVMCGAQAAPALLLDGRHLAAPAQKTAEA